MPQIRPCPRCVRLGRESTCVDAVRATRWKRKRPVTQPSRRQKRKPSGPAALPQTNDAVLPGVVVHGQPVAAIPHTSAPTAHATPMQDDYTYIRVPRQMVGAVLAQLREFHAHAPIPTRNLPPLGAMVASLPGTTVYPPPAPHNIISVPGTSITIHNAQPFASRHQTFSMTAGTNHAQQHGSYHISSN